MQSQNLEGRGKKAGIVSCRLTPGYKDTACFKRGKKKRRRKKN